MKKINKFFVLILLTICFTSCQTLADLTAVGLTVAGATGVIEENVATSLVKTTSSLATASESITPENEYYIGRATANAILNQYKLLNNKNLTKYLNNICGAITINSSTPYLYKGYYVAVLDTDEINAMATPGGHIFVTKGLIDLTNSEDELAAVIAHEVAHIQKQHSVKAIKTSRFTKFGLDATSSALAVATNGEVAEITGAFEDSVKDVFNSLVDSGYSKDQEYEADAYALQLLQQAGYNPFGLQEMINSLDKNTDNSQKGFYKTHPSPKSRSTKLQKEIKNYSQIEVTQERVSRFSNIKK